jgi:carbon starvation protein
MGAVHDFGAMVVSMRREGRSIGELTSDIINRRVRILFLLIIFFELWIVMAIFALIIAILFTMYPQAVIPVWFEIPIAISLGYLIYKRGMSAFWLSILAVGMMYITVIIGTYLPIDLKEIFGISPNVVLIIWILIVIIFDAWLASSLPVQTLLQPRDFINSHQLLVAMVLLGLGVLIARPQMVAPTLNLAPKGAPPIWPFIFVVIACGAISGFHSLVSSGTSSKQCARETDSLFIGYGGMLMEGTLAVLAIIAVGAGIGLGFEGFSGTEAFNHHYGSWIGGKGLGYKLSAFIQGSANMLKAYHIPVEIAISVMAVFIVSFAATTVDTATRIQRYVIVELSRAWGFGPLTRRQVATFFAVFTALVLAFYDGTGKGAMRLWPLFGTVNQLLAGLALLVVTVYLAHRKVNIFYTAIPMVFMVFMTGWAMIFNVYRFYSESNWLLLIIGSLVFMLKVWMIIEGVIVLRKVYGSSSSKVGR